MRQPHSESDIDGKEVKSRNKVSAASSKVENHINKPKDDGKSKARKKNGEDMDEYMVWKKNISCIYDCLCHHSLSWASLTCSFGTKGERSKNYGTIHSLYYSSRTDATFTPSTYTWSGKPSEILIAEVDVPLKHTASRKHLGRFSERQKSGRVQVKRKIIHPGEVNRVRAFAKQPHLIVSKTDSKSVYFWDVNKQANRITSKELKQEWVKNYLEPLKASGEEIESSPGSSYANIPDLTLDGHTAKAEYAIDCCSDSMKVLSGGSDAMLMSWNVDDYQTSLQTKGNRIQARNKFMGHSDNVEDCAFKPGSSEICCSVGDDKRVVICDSRAGEKYISRIDNAHMDDINCCSFNKFNPNYFLTGSSDTKVKLFDLRRISAGDSNLLENPAPVVKTFDHHSDIVLNVKWSPSDSRYFASSGMEVPLYIWDCAIAHSTTSSDSIDPSLLFMHVGQKYPIVDFAWNADDPWMFATCTEANDGGGVLQIWRISDFVTQRGNTDFKSKLNSMWMDRANSGSKSTKSADSDENSH